MRIIIFGKDGQLGKAFKALFDAAEPRLPKSIIIQYIGRAQCDLSDQEKLADVLKQFAPHLIINASAYTAVDKAETEIELAYAVNALAPEIMAQYAAQNSATLLHYSTDYVFDGEKYGFYLEDDIRNPLGVYGKSKAAGEEAIIKAFSAGTSGQYAIFRTSWVYGVGGNFIRTILRLAKERDELKVIHDQHGVPTSAAWLAGVSLDLVLNQDGELKTFPSGIYHAVPAGETTWYGLASFAVQVAAEVGATLKVTSIKPIPATDYPLPAPRPKNSRMATDKLQAVLTHSKNYFSDISISYIDLNGLSSFPHWEVMVQDYVKKLVLDASTQNQSN